MASLAGPGDVGIRVTLDESQAAQGARRVEAELVNLDKVVQVLGQHIDQAMRHLGDTSQATQGIRNLMEEERKEAEEAKKAAAEHHKHMEAMRQAAKAAQEKREALNNLRQGLTQIAAATAAATAAMGMMAKQFLDAYKESQAAEAGLDAVGQRMIGSGQAARDAAAGLSLVNAGLLSIPEASKAMQAGLATGFTLQETIDLINAFGDAAAFNRQQNLQYGESIVRAMEGVRMGNSVLSDAAGITKNLTQILKEHGYAEQDLVRVSSDAAVRRTLYNGILHEAALFHGNAARAADMLTGAESRVATETFKAKAAIGEALAPAVQSLYGALGPMLQSLTTWAQTNPELARTLFLVVGGAVAFTAALTGMAAAALAFNAALGPVGWGLAALGVAAGATAGYMASVIATGQQAERTRKSLSDLVDEYDRLSGEVNDTTLSEDDHNRAANEMRRVLEQIRDISPDLVKGYRLQRDALDELNAKLDESVEKGKNAQGVWAGIKAGIIATLLANSTTQGLTANALPEPPPAAPDDDWLGLKWYLINKDRKLTPTEDDGNGGGGGGTGSKMSPALAAALEDLQDLQALEKTPDTLQRTLAKVREILQTHGAELTKLGKDRDLIRLRDIALPQEISQAEFQAAMRDLNAQQQLGKISPEQLKQGLEKIKADFADYLKGHPDEALQLDLRIKGASEEELRKPLEQWRQAFDRAQKAGLFDGAGGLDRKLLFLQSGMSLAQTANDQDAIAEFTGQIKQLEAVLQQARFDEKFKAIGDARERAFAGAAAGLADLEKQLIDAEAAGNTTLAASIRQQMLDAVRPAMEAQRDALEKLLQDTNLTAEQRAQIQQQLNGVLQELYDQDVSAHRIASEAKVAQERAAAQAAKDARELLRQAQKADLDHIKEKQRAEEEAQAARIKGLQDELAQLERQWAAEDRRNRIADLKTELANVMADTRFQKVDANGNLVWTYDEARARELQQQIADAERDDERTRQREALQDQITAAQDELNAMRDAHQQAYDERQTYWENLLALDDASLLELVANTDLALGDGEDGWYGVLSKWLTEAATTANDESQSIVGSLQEIIDKAKEARDALNGTGGAGAITNAFGAAMQSLATSLAAPTLPNLTAPTLPASLAASTGAANTVVSTVPQTIIINGASDPQATAAAVKGAASTGAQDGVSQALRAARGAISQI